VHISHLEDPWETKDRAALILKHLSRYAYAFAVSTLINGNRTTGVPPKSRSTSYKSSSGKMSEYGCGQVTAIGEGKSVFHGSAFLRSLLEWYPLWRVA